jgi:hypothetical protein
MKIAFTLCSNNYLAQAITLRDSFLFHHPGYKFYIGLVDSLDNLPNLIEDTNDFIPVANLVIPEFNEMVQRYNITELNTSVKPFYFEYIFDKYNPEWIFYIDPDIYVYNRFEEVEMSLYNNNEVVLTPHILSPVGDWDICYIREGLFNLGFVAFINSPSVKKFLNWWKQKMINQGFFSYQNNQFYDQLWMNFAVVFLKQPYILIHPGYNVSGWNLHERIVLKDKNEFYINDLTTKLVFYHFSGLGFDNSTEEISKHAPGITIRNRKDLEEILTIYKRIVISNNLKIYREIKPFYKHSEQRILKKYFNKVILKIIIMFKRIILKLENQLIS